MKQGAKTVSNVHDEGTKQATLGVTICGYGHKLKPFLFFEGKSGDRIEYDLTSFWADCHYVVQGKAWMDEQLVHYWIDNIVAPDIKTAPHGIIPNVILNFYRVH